MQIHILGTPSRSEPNYVLRCTQLEAAECMSAVSCYSGAQGLKVSGICAESISLQALLSNIRRRACGAEVPTENARQPYRCFMVG